MIGTAEELAAAGYRGVPPATAQTAVGITVRGATTSTGSVRCKRVLEALHAFRDDVNPNFFKAFAASMTLLLSATVLLRYTYHKPGMSYHRRAVLLHRDHRHRRLRRLQLHRPTDLAAAVRHRADVRRRHVDRRADGVRRRPAAVAAHRAERGAAQGPRAARPRHRRRPRFVRHPRGRRPQGGRATTSPSSSATPTTASCRRRPNSTCR